MLVESQLSLTTELENEFDSCLMNRLVPNSHWREDRLTEDVLKAIGTLANWEHGAQHRNVQVRVNAQKLFGNSEFQYGDICLLVDVRRNGRFFQGVAYIEAKKQGLFRTGFPALEEEQISRIQRRGAPTQILLYCTSAYAWTYGALPGVSSVVPKTRALTTPATSYLSHNSLRPSLPLSAQIAHRYLNGFDLMLQASAVDSALRRAESDYYVLLKEDDGQELKLHRNVAVPRELVLPSHLEDIRTLHNWRLENERGFDESNLDHRGPELGL